MKRVLIFLLLSAVTGMAAEDRTQFKLDTSEAEAVLAIVDNQSAGKQATEADWQRLFTSQPYVRLKQREAGRHRAFTDDEFKSFVLSTDLAKRAPDLRHTLEAWQKTDLRTAADRVLPYLPATARVRATVYPVIKPLSNSFVSDTDTDPAIFLYLDPNETTAEFATTVAHESHHIGFADAGKEYEKRIKSLPANARQAADWMTAFGEGLAMLAAAGSPDVNPLHDFSRDQRARWDEDMKTVNQQLGEVNQFFLDIVQGGFTKPEVADHLGFTFFGYRGPWYTVGYLMASTVEKRFGRAVLIECTADPRLLLARYNQAAAEQNAAGNGQNLPLWSPEVLKAVSVQ